MERTQIYLTKKEREYLKRVAKEDGLAMSEIIRRILDNYIKENDSNDKVKIHNRRCKKDG